MNIGGTIDDDNLIGTDADDWIRGLSGNDTLSGGEGHDFLEGGAGNDILIGGAGRNTYAGGTGDDTYVLTGSSEHVKTGLGHDIVDLSNFTNGMGYLSLSTDNATTSANFAINGATGFGAIYTTAVVEDQHVRGETTIQNLNNALQRVDGSNEWTMALNGSNVDNYFTINAGKNGAIILYPGSKHNLIKIEGKGGTVRLDYFGADGGIEADLSKGIVIVDGDFNSHDRITGNGRVKEIRGTSYDDRIHGSRKNDSFVSTQGDDTISGGRGEDTIRYDRLGIEAVTVDLAKKSATGTWAGEAFTHNLSNIEHIRGSREGDDVLGGNHKDNLLEGNGGDDTLAGGRGNDTLDGGEGSDVFVFARKSGTDVIVDFDATDNAEKIDLSGVNRIKNFRDLKKNHMEQDGDNVVITDRGDHQIILQDVDLSDLERSDFLF